MSLAERIWGKAPLKHSKDEIESDLKVIIQDFLKISPQLQIKIFGSFTRNEATEFSDIDLAIIVSDEVNLKELKKEFFKSRTPLKRPVDFIFRTHSSLKNKNEFNLIDDEIVNNGVEIYPEWKFND